MSMDKEPEQGEGASAPPPVPRRWYRFGLMARLRNYFLTGLIVTAPVILTVYVTWLFVDFVDSKVKPLIPHSYDPTSYLPFAVPGLGVLLALAFLTAVGFVAVTYLGRGLVSIGEAIVSRMPVVRGIYAAFKQIFQTVFAQSADTFREVVLVRLGQGQDMWVLGFITSTVRHEVHDRTRADVVHVFVPTTPNPTSGFLLFVPRDDLMHLDMSVEDGIKLVVSGGIVVPAPLGADTGVRPRRAGRGHRGEKPAPT